MKWQLKKIFSVLFALLIGVSVVFFAWKSGSVTYTGNTTDNNLWRDALSVVPQDDSLKTINASQGDLTANDATTTVDIVARNLLTNYALAQKSDMSTTTLSDANITAIAQTAVGKIKLPEARRFTAMDINISNDNSSVGVDAYMKEVGSLVKTFTLSQTKNDIEVVFAIPKTGDDTKRLADIEKDISRYEKLIKGLLVVKTPSLINLPHLHLVQKYANIQASIRPMADIFTDSLKGLAALAVYRAEIAEFNLIAKEYADYISNNQQ